MDRKRNLLVGAILTAISAAFAPGLSAFYGEPRLFWVTIALGMGFLFNGAGVQHAAVLQREMRFTTLAIVEIISLCVSVAVGLAMALGGYGYWALVGMSVSLPLASSVGAWVTAGWIPSRPSHNRGLGSMLKFGGIVTLNGLVVYLAYNADKLLLGRFAGVETLGIYGRAYQLVSIPTENLHSALSGVALSALSRLQSDAYRFRSYFLKGYSLFISLTVPITLACALFATDIVDVLLGPKWTQAAPIFRALAPTIVVFALINPLGWFLFATGRIERSLRLAFFVAPLVIAAYAFGLKYGASGVAIGFSGMMMTLTVPFALWAVHDTIISPRDLLRAAKPPMVAALVATAVALPFSLWLQNHLTSLWRLLIEGTLLAASYAVVLYYIAGQKDLLERLFRDFAHSWSSTRQLRHL